MIDLKTRIGSLTLKNPIILASGTCGYGDAYKDFYSPKKLGAVVTKGISLKPREGNPPPRLWEVECGLINSVGLENIGLERFIKEKLPELRKSGAEIVVNIFGEREREYYQIAERLSEEQGICALELNLSCPNVKKGGLEFGKDPKTIEKITREVKKRTNLPVWVKLSLSRAEPSPLARAGEEAGADALVITNTLKAMAVDLERKKPALPTITGGLSGPAIKPVALAGVWEVVQAVRIPVIACGGIFSGRDALEFLLLGARAVQMGTAVLVDPLAPMRALEEIKRYFREQGISSLKDWVGKIDLNEQV